MTFVVLRALLRNRIGAALALFVVLSASVDSPGQADVYPPKKPTPGRIAPEVLFLAESVVGEQWPAALLLVNAPSGLKQVEPGQCIRFGVVATGDDRQQLLETAKFMFEFDVAGKTQIFAAEPPLVTKRVKPEGGDFVTQALAVASIKHPVDSLASLAASRAKWCAPADVQDGTATLRGAVWLAGGKSVLLNSHKLDVKTFESARKQPAFIDMDTFGSWVQRYHNVPDPAQLLLGLRLVAADAKARSMYSMMTFFIAALRVDPIAAGELIRRLPAEDSQTRLYAVPLLRYAGYPSESLLDGFKDEEKTRLRSFQIPDAFDIKPDQVLPNKMDMLWAMFFATGRIEPVRTLASMLAWREDYDKFRKMQESGQRLTELTDSIMRGVVYTAAGWSLASLSRNDTLVADYIDVLKSSPDTPQQVRAELENLYTNPAFTKK